ncbi:PLP-dependent aminotransferase family protein [Vulcanisaeta souniana]|uniref:GntR family transcriptional regulator n=1 Tax=Vulcanisaeta souniana JCM 11219 TaxID=1293586 RepID=A0A830E5A1_9CREN|nr:PLP-dependent aminotransferase family protein [Vulcanisaeta souniana]BDR92992.1 GntR family transcriptional regulator [Vulcanisaeta souniana JCM 11219]GGI83718.1 GntR family transcriptional regulator [Vulcanisaeta souniana JCM 11219]
MRLYWSPVELASRLVKRGITYNFASGSPDPSLLPINDVKRSFETVYENYGTAILAYPGAGGLRELRIEVSRYLNENLNINANWRDIIITAGAQHAIKLLSQLLIRRRTAIYTENPTFVETVAPMRYEGARLIGVPISDDGMDTHELEKLAKNNGPGIVYTVPNCHNPTGVSLSRDKRKHLLEIADRYELRIIEDDPYTPLHSNAEPALKSMENDVIYVGTLSKILGPGLRIGFVVTSGRLRNNLEMIEQHDFATSTLTQYIVYDLLRRGVANRVIHNARRLYPRKLRELVDSLNDYLPGAIMYNPYCGFYSFIRTQINAWDLLRKSIRQGVAFVPGDRFFIDAGKQDTARLSIGSIRTELIRDGVKVLSSIIKGV